MQNSSAAISSGSDISSVNLTVGNTLQDALTSDNSATTSASTGTAGFTSSDSDKKVSISPDKIDLSKENVAVFKAK